jgi:stress response protein YsnF
MNQSENHYDDGQSPNHNQTEDIEHVIPLGEETLTVDKRRIEGRKTTIRRVVLERPASADVNLEAETVVVEMRDPVDLNTIGRVLEETTYEAQDFAEEPVVSKEPRIVQEVIVRRIKSLQVQTINETLRYDDVQIEHSDEQENPSNEQEQAQATG